MKKQIHQWQRSFPFGKKRGIVFKRSRELLDAGFALTRRIYRRGVMYIDRSPLRSFFIALSLLLLLIFVSAFFRRTPPAKPAPVLVKAVHVYRIGSVPKVTVQATVEKSGVITITALTSGVVQQIFVKVGDSVEKGKTLLSLASNYQGGNALSTQKSIAAAQAKHAKDTYQEQIDLIGNQRRQADLLSGQAGALRDIQNQSVSDTSSLIDLNNSILDSVNQSLQTLTQNNSTGSNDQTILSLKELKSQFSAGNNQLHQALLQSQYQAGSRNAPTLLSNVQRDITKKQLDIAEKTITLNRDLSRLQLQLAQITEAQMYPSSPFAATVQRVFVREGQAVTPGAQLVLLSQNENADPAVAIALVGKQIADRVSQLQPSTLTIENASYDTYPSFISQDAVSGTLYAIFYPIPQDVAQKFTDKGMISVSIPIGNPDTSASVPFVPIDSVYQTESTSYVFVNKGGTVAAETVTLGSVYGSFVSVTRGLSDGDAIITDRTIVTGDLVKEGE